MGAQRALTYGEIADNVLPSVVFPLHILQILAEAVDSYVKLAPRDRHIFFQEQMDGIWPDPIDWTSRPQSPEFRKQWAALRRYFKEQGRIRGQSALPEKLSTRQWTGLRVCGVVYKDSIDEMVFLGTGMRPGDSRGYIGHRMKCRTVFYWKLSPGERQELIDMAKDWQSGALPNEQKMDGYYRRFQTWIRTVHLTALRQFGQHLVTMAIPEPGLTNPPRLYEFMHELKILDKPLVKLVPVGDTLSDIYLEVNHAAGRIEGAALPAVLTKKSRLKRKTTWSLDRDSFVGHDEVVLREEEFDEELFYKEAISMVYMIVRMAHSNISAYQDLDPPWSSFHDLVDARYLLPDVPMCIPTSLRQPNCFKYLKHWFTVTKGLRFDRWQRKNSLSMPPVPLQERWWAASLSDFVAPLENVPPSAFAAMQYVPQPLDPRVAIDENTESSPYGSMGGHLVHDESAREQEAVDMLDIPAVCDPDDFWALPPGDVNARQITLDSDAPPCLVPPNGEARAQWCLIQLKTHCGLPLRVTRALRKAIQQMSELPMVPNASYPLTAAAKRTGLPGDLRWTLRRTSAPETAGDMQVWLSFLQSSPWAVRQGSADVFAGTELVWTFILGWVLYLRDYAAAGGSAVGDSAIGIYTVGSASFSKVFSDFYGALCNYAELYAYPGWAPSAKYALVSSRSHYLAYLVRNEDQDLLLPLLKLVTKMDEGPLQPPLKVIPHSSSREAPTWMTDPNGVPSWQWQRCGLPPSSHSNPDLPQLLYSWFGRLDLLVDIERGVARSRETGLAVLLKVALIYRDLENIDDGNWTLAGAAGLEDSSLRPHTRPLKAAIADWANEEAVRLEGFLPAISHDHAGDFEDRADEDEDPLQGERGQYAELDAPSPPAPVPAGKRFAVSDVMPANMDAGFMAVDLEDVGLAHTVGEYRTLIEAQPRTAVQELSRKGLQGVAELEARKKLNRALRGGLSIDKAKRSGRTSNPAPPRTSGGWLPMPPPRQSPSWSDEEDVPPPAKRRKLLLKPHQPRRSQEQAVGTAAKPRGRGKKHPGRQTTKRPKSTKAALKAPPAARKRRRPSVDDEDSQSSESPLEFESHEESDQGWPSQPNSPTSPMPEQISGLTRSRYALAGTAVQFDACGASSGMEIDSDDVGSARSVRRMAPQRLAFIEPNPVISSTAARASPAAPPPQTRPRPRRTEAFKAARARQGREPLQEEALDATSATQGDLRRSARLKSTI